MTSVAADPLVIRPPPDLVQQQPALRRTATDLALRYAHRELVTDDLLRAMGEGLWRALSQATSLSGDLERAREAAGIAVLPLVIECAQPEVLQLPWETLHHPELGFLGRDPGFALSRRLAPPPSKVPAPERSPLRVLLFTSLPEDLDPERGRLDVEAEQAAVQRPWPPGSPRAGWSWGRGSDTRSCNQAYPCLCLSEKGSEPNGTDLSTMFCFAMAIP